MNNPFNSKEDNKAIPRVTVDELALMTKNGFDEVHVDMKKGFEEVKEEFANVRNEMKEGFDEVKKEFTNVRNEMKTEFANVRNEMKTEFANVRNEMKEGFGGLRQSIALVLENMATKSDIERLESRLGDVEHTVYKSHSPRLKRVEHKLQIVA